MLSIIWHANQSTVFLQKMITQRSVTYFGENFQNIAILHSNLSYVPMGKQRGTVFIYA